MYISKRKYDVTEEEKEGVFQYIQCGARKVKSRGKSYMFMFMFMFMFMPSCSSGMQKGGVNGEWGAGRQKGELERRESRVRRSRGQRGGDRV